MSDAIDRRPLKPSVFERFVAAIAAVPKDEIAKVDESDGRDKPSAKPVRSKKKA